MMSNTRPKREEVYTIHDSDSSDSDISIIEEFPQKTCDQDLCISDGSDDSDDIEVIDVCEKKEKSNKKEVRSNASNKNVSDVVNVSDDDDMKDRWSNLSDS